MFTGIVQELGEIRECAQTGKAMLFSFKAPLLSQSIKVGESVACDGVCLTVERSGAGEFSVCAVPETLSKTTLSEWKVGSVVNLEPALTPQTPMGGHFMMGHIDAVCEVVAMEKLSDGEGCEIAVRLPAEFLSYCVYKGSLALSGISLTITSVDEDVLRFAIIPHTLKATKLGAATVGTRLNFEVDVLAKYVERQLQSRHAGITESDLEKWGYEVR